MIYLLNLKRGSAKTLPCQEHYCCPTRYCRLVWFFYFQGPRFVCAHILIGYITTVFSSILCHIKTYTACVRSHTIVRTINNTVHHRFGCNLCVFFTCFPHTVAFLFFVGKYFFVFHSKTRRFCVGGRVYTQ